MKTTKDKKTVTIIIDCCNDCPFAIARTRQVGLSTGNDYVLDWFCKKQDKKIVTVYFDEKAIIPEFCPLTIN